jgi:hypothetical protein
VGQLADLEPPELAGRVPKGSRVIFRKPDHLDERMLDRSYYFASPRQVRQREVLSVCLTGKGAPVSSGEILGKETSVTGVYSQLLHFSWKLEAAHRSTLEFSTLEVRHTHPGSYEPHRYHFSPQDRRASLKLRKHMDSTPGLRHLVLRESIIFEKGGGKKVTRVKTYELPPQKRFREH